jgi:hypothetical protein
VIIESNGGGIQWNNPALISALIAATVTIIGWFSTYWIAKRREDNTRRLEILLKYRQRQIEELYGPLVSLIDQIFNVWEVRENILGPSPGRYSNEDQQRIRQFFWNEYFHPLHQEIRNLLRTKLYLLEGGHIPDTFLQYLQHSTQEESQHRLWDELQIDTKNTPRKEFPRGFYENIKGVLLQLMAEHQTGLCDLH